jgi:hypothetical protein
VTDTDLERRLMAMASESSERTIDTDRAWRDLQLLRSQAAYDRRRWAAAAAAAAAAAVTVIAIAIRVLAGSLHAGSPVAVPSVSGPVGGSSSAPAVPGAYPAAIVARIPVAVVVSLVQDGPRVWAVRALLPTAGVLALRPTAGRAASYQLVRIDLRTDKVTLRADLGPGPRVVAAGGGAVWLTTANGQARGQLVRIDPATGRVIATLHLPAGQCSYATYAAGRLWAQCADGSAATLVLRVSPVTGRVDEQLGPVRGRLESAIVVAPQGIWYRTGSGISGLVGISGPVGSGGRARAVTVNDAGFPASLATTQSLVFGQGALWAMTNDETVAKIDPATGRIVRTFTYRSYDPAYRGGLRFLAVGQSSLWFWDFLSDGVLRVSMTTGRPLGRVPDAGSCGGVCQQIYATQSAVWVPALGMLVRIDPARLPA